MAEVYEGNDNVVRVCKVKTPTTTVIRPVVKLRKLPVEPLVNTGQSGSTSVPQNGILLEKCIKTLFGSSFERKQSVSPMTHFVFGRKFLCSAVLLIALNPPSSFLALERFYKRAFLSVSVIYYLKFIVVCYIELRSIQYSLSHPIALCSPTDIKFIILTHDYKASLLLIPTLPLLEALSRCSSTRLGSVDNSVYHIEHT